MVSVVFDQLIDAWLTGNAEEVKNHESHSRVVTRDHSYLGKISETKAGIQSWNLYLRPS